MILYKLLIVEDEFGIREGLGRFDWSSLGIEVVGKCEHGLLAYQWISENSVDIVLSDIHMPIMGGLELADLINQNYPYISIVILTGYSDFEYARASIRYGVIDYLVKPVDFSEIKEVFERIVNTLNEKHQYIIKNEMMEKKNRIFSSILRKKFLKELLNNPLTYEDIEEGISYSEMITEASSFAVLLFKLDGYMEKEVSYEESDRKLIAFALDNIMQEYCNTQELGYYWVDSLTLESYILVVDNGQGDIGRLSTVAESVKNTLYTLDGILKTTISCGIGSVEAELDKIFFSAECARTVLLKKKTEDEIIICDYETSKELISVPMEKTNEVEPKKINEKLVNIESSKHIIKAAIKYIDENYTKTITLDEVSGIVFLNAAYFSYLFKNVCGMNFINYLTSLRINKAKELLKDPKFKVQEISEAVGYENSRYFSQIFKKYTTFTPYEFRSRL